MDSSKLKKKLKASEAENSHLKATLRELMTETQALMNNNKNLADALVAFQERLGVESPDQIINVTEASQSV